MADTSDLKTEIVVFVGLLIPVKVLEGEPIENFIRLTKRQ
jgi:hypothetical protein